MKNSMLRILILATVMVTMMTSMVSVAAEGEVNVYEFTPDILGITEAPMNQVKSQWESLDLSEYTQDSVSFTTSDASLVLNMSKHNTRKQAMVIEGYLIPEEVKNGFWFKHDDGIKVIIKDQEGTVVATKSNWILTSSTTMEFSETLEVNKVYPFRIEYFDWGGTEVLKTDIPMNWFHSSIPEFTVTFDPAEGTPEPSDETVVMGASATEPSEPTRDSDSFLGWYEVEGSVVSDTAYDFTSVVEGDVNLIAKWEDYEAPDVDEYTVTFDPAEGTPDPADQTVVEGESATEPSNPTRDLDTFLGWHEVEGSLVSDTAYDFTSAVEGDVNLIAKWEDYEATEVVEYTVSFDPAEGTPDPADQTVVEGESATEPSNPTRDLDTFLGWYEVEGSLVSDIAYDFTSAVEGNVNLIAKWEDYEAPDVDEYTVTFDPAEGTPDPVDQTVVEGESATEPNNPTRDLDTFLGWYEVEGSLVSDTAYDFTSAVEGNVNLIAKWEDYEAPEVVEYTVSFDSAEGTPDPADQTVVEGESATEPSNPTRDLDTFLGWHEVEGSLVSDIAYDFTSAVEGDVNLIAVWEDYEATEVVDYTVTFDPAEGTPEPSDQTVVEGSSATEPSDPTRDSDTFLGWYEFEGSVVSDTAYDFTSAVEGNLNLIAKWDDYVKPSSRSKKAKTFDLTVIVVGEGEVKGAGEYDDDDTATLIATPAEGYRFDKWIGADENGEVLMDDDQEVTAVFIIEEDLTDDVLTELPEAPGEAPILDEVDTEIDGIDDIQDEALPQTGGLPFVIYAGLGTVMAGSGFRLRKRK